MPMQAIEETINGEALTFLLTSEALAATLDRAALHQAFAPQIGSIAHAFAARPGEWSSGGGTTLLREPTAEQWAKIIDAAPAATTSQIPQEQIIAVLEAALIGGGMEATAAAHAAHRVVHHQTNRSADFLAADIVLAAVAAE
jgi:hypothetical protein